MVVDHILILVYESANTYIFFMVYICENDWKTWLSSVSTNWLGKKNKWSLVCQVKSRMVTWHNESPQKCVYMIYLLNHCTGSKWDWQSESSFMMKLWFLNGPSDMICTSVQSDGTVSQWGIVIA